MSGTKRMKIQRIRKVNHKEELVGHAKLLEVITNQKKWIEEHGSDLAGYIDRYGDPGITERWSGEGGSAIFNADAGYLFELETRACKRGALAWAARRPFTKVEVPEVEDEPDGTEFGYYPGEDRFETPHQMQQRLYGVG